MVRQVSFFHVDIKILPFSDSAEDIFLDVYLILLVVEHVKTQTWHITIHASSYQQCSVLSHVLQRTAIFQLQSTLNVSFLYTFYTAKIACEFCSAFFNNDPVYTMSCSPVTL